MDRRERFISKILPPYLRRSKSVSELLPLLYLRGLSTGDFREALPVLLGENAAGPSPSAITRLTHEWQGEYEKWKTRSLADRDYIYVWVDGVHFGVRLEDERLCTLVMIGVRPDGNKEVIVSEDGYRESAESWASLLRDVTKRGVRAPEVAVGDGALGFWAALRDVWPKTREQRCWVHKIVCRSSVLTSPFATVSASNAQMTKRTTTSSQPRRGCERRRQISRNRTPPDHDVIHNS